MTQSNVNLSQLRRPKLLVRAARAAMQEYSRHRDLKQISGISSKLNGRHLFAALLQEEITMEESRLLGDATYNVRNHICIITALLAESTQTTAYKIAA